MTIRSIPLRGTTRQFSCDTAATPDGACVGTTGARPASRALSHAFAGNHPLAGGVKPDDNRGDVSTLRKESGRDDAEAASTESIDRNATEPVYAQLVRILRRQVADGILRPGDQLPSEAQLCRRYGVSPMTVRRVVNILADQGIVVGEQGRGTFIRPVELGDASFQLQRLQDLVGGDQPATVRLLQASIVAADRQTAQKLNCQPGERLIYMRRLIEAEAGPVCYHVEYLMYDPARPVVEAEIATTSLQGLFGGFGQPLIKHGELHIEAVLLSDDEARLLQAPPPAAGLRIEHLFYAYDERPMSWGWFLCRGDRLRFGSRVGISQDHRAPEGEQPR